MATLICRNCGTINTDPGGDPRQYRCGYCGMPGQLQRVLTPQEKAFAGAAAGAGIGAIIGGGLPGAVIGGIIGLLAPAIFEQAAKRQR